MKVNLIGEHNGFPFSQRDKSGYRVSSVVVENSKYDNWLKIKGSNDFYISKALYDKGVRYFKDNQSFGKLGFDSAIDKDKQVNSATTFKQPSDADYVDYSVEGKKTKVGYINILNSSSKKSMDLTKFIKGITGKNVVMYILGSRGSVKNSISKPASAPASSQSEYVNGYEFKVGKKVFIRGKVNFNGPKTKIVAGEVVAIDKGKSITILAVPNVITQNKAKPTAIDWEAGKGKPKKKVIKISQKRSEFMGGYTQFNEYRSKFMGIQNYVDMNN